MPPGTLQRLPFGGEQILHGRCFRALTEKRSEVCHYWRSFIGSEFAAAVYQGPLASHIRELRWD
jgi:hypothetical protein